MSLSAWFAEAAEERLRNYLLGKALDAWQAEDGPFTEEEMEEAYKRLGWERRPNEGTP